MVLSFRRLQQTFRFSPQIVRDYFSLFLITHLTNVGFNQVMIYLQEQRMNSKDDMFVPMMIGIALIGFAVQSLIRVLWTLAACHFFHKKSLFSDFLRAHGELGLIETLRSFFRATLWGFLLIIPGLIKVVRYQFVVYIVALSPRYQRGEVDALEGSEALTRGHLLSLSFLLIVFLVISLMCSSNELLSANPLAVTLAEVCSFVLGVLQTVYFLLLFKDLQAARKDLL